MKSIEDKRHLHFVGVFFNGVIIMKEKYLVIELDELGDVPRVFYKGEEITMKEFINFQWQTRTDEIGSTDVIIDYYVKPKKKDVVVHEKSIREGVRS